MKFGSGYVIEYTGEVFRNMSMDERMTVCNMSIEAGARAGLIAPDEVTFEYCRGRKYAPQGEDFEAAIKEWKELRTDPGATYDKTIVLDGNHISPMVTWGINPGMVLPVDAAIPGPEDFAQEDDQKEAKRAYEYMGVHPHQRIEDITIEHVFIGSCTNSRMTDLRQAASMIEGQKVADHVRAIVVPGSQSVKLQAEEEGLHEIFLEAGFEWRESGCSMCLSMNNDVVPEGERCASTSNRNFEGRQGKGARTHLVSPAMAAMAAIHGRFVDVRKFNQEKTVV